MFILNGDNEWDNIYLIGYYVINNDFVFHISNLEQEAILYNFSEEKEQKIKMAFEDNLSHLGDNENYDELLNHNDLSIRQAFAKLAVKLNLEKYLDILVLDKCFDIRKEIAKTNNPKYLKLLFCDINYNVVSQSIKSCFEYNLESLLDYLVTRNDYDYKYIMAGFKNQKYLNILVYDKNEFVRKKVATHNNLELLKILVNDKNNIVVTQVLHTAVKYNIEPILDIFLVKDNEMHKSYIANYSDNKKYLKILSNDKSDCVRKSLTSNETYLIEVLNEL